jgi:hypothetical protein
MKSFRLLLSSIAIIVIASTTTASELTTFVGAWECSWVSNFRQSTILIGADATITYKWAASVLDRKPSADEMTVKGNPLDENTLEIVFPERHGVGVFATIIFTINDDKLSANAKWMPGSVGGGIGYAKCKRS